jgi:hypothetical protein
MYGKQCTVEIHISGLIGMANHPDMQKIRIIGISKWKKKFYKKAVLGYIFISI